MKNSENTFTPHISTQSKIPALCFKPGHYLGWFHGCCFQVSATEDGSADLGSSAKTLTGDLLYANDLPAELKPLIALSHMCEAGIPFDEFWDLLADDPKLVNNFISVIDDMCGIYSNNLDICSIESIIQTIEKDDVTASVNDPCIFAASKPFACIVQNSNEYAPLGNLILCRDSVQIQDSENGLAYKISFPDYRYIGNDIKASEKEYYGLLWNRLPWILFCYAGIILEVNGSRIRYERSNTKPIQKTNEITNKHEFFEYIRDTLTNL